MTGLSACLPVYSTDAIRRKVVQLIIAKRLEKNGFNFVFNSKTYYL